MGPDRHPGAVRFPAAAGLAQGSGVSAAASRVAAGICGILSRQPASLSRKPH
jgi:hypothetical protein